jgi:hypothetical protein
MGWARRPWLTGLGPPQPSCLPSSRGVSSRVFWILPPSACGPLSSVSLLVGRSLLSCKAALFWLGPRSLSSSRVRSLGFLESCLLHCMTCTGLQGLVKVLHKLIPEVLLSTSKPYINTKLQNRHARMNLLYQGG